jgi:parallel beta-helix repeat protein
LTVPTDAGWVTLVTCTRIRVENLNLSFGQKISLISTTNSIVTKNVMKHNQVCIYLDDSSNNTIEENILTDSEFGIQLEDSSSNYIWCNNVTNNTKGIDLTSSTKNVIQQNDIRRNNHGIRLTVSTCNIISGNHLTENIQGICLERRLTIMDYDDPYNSTVIYACSNNTVSKNNINENNCGVWMSSASNNTFSGNNFINNTDQIKMEDFTSFLVASGIEPTSSRFASINFWDDGKEITGAATRAMTAMATA